MSKMIPHGKMKQPTFCASSASQRVPAKQVLRCEAESRAAVCWAKTNQQRAYASERFCFSAAYARDKVDRAACMNVDLGKTGNLVILPASLI